MTDPRWEELADRLDAISDELGDLAIERVREALASGAGTRPDADRILARVRRSVDKAAHLLRAGASDGDDDRQAP
jgi:hypothetical protein